MSTKQYFKASEIRNGSPLFSMARATIESVFYGNNVRPVETLKEAYYLAMESPGTVVTDMPVYNPEFIGLPADAKVLLFNDGEVTGRAAAARKIVGEPGVNVDTYCAIVREAIYNTRYRNLYHAQAYVGLDPEFMTKAHLCIPEGEENVMYSWLLNFQFLNEYYARMYANSKPYPEGDIYIFSDPSWSHPDFPMGLTFFDPKHNCAAILGMRYFGEHKKGTLTLAWGMSSRHGYVACHGGQKRYNLPSGSFVAGVFGLSGSGKSTITHAGHGGKYDVTVLHDDAFVLSLSDCSSIALEPAYFDKTQDYPTDSPDNKYLLTLQNNAVTLDENGRKVLMAEDIRNGNGRAMKSRLWSPNRVDRFDEPANAIFWLMKDPTLPPVVKINNPALASILGATLATKRSSAERLAPGVDPNALVIEPYANPFRTYPLASDYSGFKMLFAEKNVDCYILNTGDFMGKKVTKEITLGILESIIEKRAKFVPMGTMKDLQILEIEGFMPDFKDAKYTEQFAARMQDRVQFVQSRDTFKDGFDKLPADALEAITSCADQASGK